MTRLVALLLPSICVSIGHERMWPPFIFPRSPQSYTVHLAVKNLSHRNLEVTNVSTGLSRHHSSFSLQLTLFSVVPDVSDELAYFIFDVDWRHDLNQIFLDHALSNKCSASRKENCSDFRHLLASTRAGGLKCEFIGTDGIVYEAPTTHMSVFFASHFDGQNGELIGTCKMPPRFGATITAAGTAGTTLPQVRVLREGDDGATAGDHFNSIMSRFENNNDRQCVRMTMSQQGSTSPSDCCSSCGAKCQMWQYTLVGNCFTSTTGLLDKVCKNRPGFLGGIRRNQPWELVDTSLPKKRLISFASATPLYGDGSYMNRIPQWIEYVHAFLVVCAIWFEQRTPPPPPPPPRSST